MVDKPKGIDAFREAVKTGEIPIEKEKPDPIEDIPPRPEQIHPDLAPSYTKMLARDIEKVTREGHTELFLVITKREYVRIDIAQREIEQMRLQMEDLEGVQTLIDAKKEELEDKIE